MPLKNETLKKNLTLAEKALAYALNFVSTSATLPELELPESNHIRKKVAAVRSRNITPLECMFSLLMHHHRTNWGYVKYHVKGSKQLKAGNCGELSYLALNYLRKENVSSAEVIGITKGDHAFVIIDRDQKSDINKPNNWGENCVVCDPLMRRFYPATEFFQNMKYHIYDPKYVKGNRYFDYIDKADEYPMSTMCTLKSDVNYETNKAILETFKEHIELIIQVYKNLLKRTTIFPSKSPVSHLQNENKSFTPTFEMFYETSLANLPTEKDLKKLSNLDLERILEKKMKNFLYDLEIMPFAEEQIDTFEVYKEVVFQLFSSGGNKEHAFLDLLNLNNEDFRKLITTQRSFTNFQNEEEGDTLLFTAIKFKKTDKINILLDAVFDINKINMKKCTPLFYVVYYMDTSMLSKFLQKGAVVNVVNEEQDDPLDIAIECNDIEKVKLLVQHGADINGNHIVYATDVASDAITEFLKNISNKRKVYHQLYANFLTSMGNYQNENVGEKNIYYQLETSALLKAHLLSAMGDKITDDQYSILENILLTSLLARAHGRKNIDFINAIGQFIKGITKLNDHYIPDLLRKLMLMMNVYKNKTNFLQHFTAPTFPKAELIDPVVKEYLKSPDDQTLRHKLMDFALLHFEETVNHPANTDSKKLL